MIYGNALRDLFMRMGRNPWQQYNMPVEPPQMSQMPFQPMPFEGGMPPMGKGGRQIPIVGMNAPNMGRNALLGMRGFGMGRMY